MKKFCIAVLVLISIFLIESCGKQYSEISPYDEGAVSHVLENALVACNNGNYEKFQNCFVDSAMKNLITKEVFATIVKNVENKYGKYIAQSEEFKSGFKNGELILAMYTAEFTGAGKIFIKASFIKRNDRYLIKDCTFSDKIKAPGFSISPGQ